MENESFVGADIDIVKFILSKANLCLRYNKMPSSSRALLELKKGSIDFLYAATFSDERAQYGVFSSPYRKEVVRVFWQKDFEKQFKQLNEANLSALFAAGLRGVSNRGSYIGEEIEALLIKNSDHILTVPQIERRMIMLERKRVDFTIEDELAGQYLIDKYQLKGISMHPKVLYSSNLSLLFNRANISQELLEKINNIIEENRTEFEKILQTYQKDIL
jgi:polar amino acid transport system substrate-binding protein